MVLLWPHPSRSAEAAPPDRVNGEVTAVQPIDCAKDPEAQVPTGEESPSGAATICGTVAVRLTSGPEAGKDITTDIPAGPGAITVAHGDDIELLYLPDSPDGQLYSIYDHQRSTQLWVLAAAFALAVIAFGRWRGLTALFGLGVTFAVLLWFIVPGRAAGTPRGVAPRWVAAAPTAPGCRREAGSRMR
jgi:hypothetical protein